MPTKDPSTHDAQWSSSPREVARKLQFLFDTNRVTAMALAERTGLPKKAIQDILDGASLPTESMLRKFADFFGVTLEFILGRDESATSKRGSVATKAKTPSVARPVAGKGSSGVSKTGATGAKRTKSAGALNIRAVATRHQALVELLVEKGVISARDYGEMVQKIEKRGR